MNVKRFALWFAIITAALIISLPVTRYARQAGLPINT